MQPIVRSHVEHGASLFTDQAAVYREIPGVAHESVNHSRGEYVRDGVTTNWIESVWALFERMLMGTYHQASRKHRKRYVAELVWRRNTRELGVRGQDDLGCRPHVGPPSEPEGDALGRRRWSGAGCQASDGRRD